MFYKSREFDQNRTDITFCQQYRLRAMKDNHTNTNDIPTFFIHIIYMLEFHSISGDITVRCTEKKIFFEKRHWNAIEQRLMRDTVERNGNANNF